jgi:hypothetical protein
MLSPVPICDMTSMATKGGNTWGDHNKTWLVAQILPVITGSVTSTLNLPIPLNQ